MNYYTNEIFYSLIGEGRWVGTPAVFIRLSGCNLNCSFCDTEHRHGGSLSAEEILSAVRERPTKHIVITGGEPLIHDLRPLLNLLFARDYLVHLETNGTQTLPPEADDCWIACSPKSDNIIPITIQQANEIKFMVGQPNWELYIAQIQAYNPQGALFLTPLADGLELNQENIQKAIDYCLANPEYSLCMQMHKILKIK